LIEYVALPLIIGTASTLGERSLVDSQAEMGSQQDGLAGASVLLDSSNHVNNGGRTVVDYLAVNADWGQSITRGVMAACAHFSGSESRRAPTVN
jgi:hypothetical protein